MPTNRQFIESIVDEKIAKGQLSEKLRDQYLNTLAADESLASAWAADLMRAGDYTRKTQALAEERRAAEAVAARERQTLMDERRRLDDWQRNAEAQIAEANRIQSQLPVLTARAAAMEQVLRNYNMLDYVEMPDMPAPQQRATTTPAQKVTPDNLNNPMYITKEDAATYLREMTILNGKVMRLQAEHQRLFGEPLNDDLHSHYLATGEDPEAHWRSKYSVDAKVAELDARNRDAERAKIREEERTKLMQEMSLDPTRLVGAPAFGDPGINPLLAHYSASRALEHGNKGFTQDAQTGQAQQNVAPEMRPQITLARERISNAVGMYTQNFAPDGRPISERGQALARQYASQD